MRQRNNQTKGDWAVVKWKRAVVGSLLCAGLIVVTTLAVRSQGPTIAAAGDIACDPASSFFHNGNGTSTHCQEGGTSNLLLSGGFTAVLDLGDNQYECGSYSAYTASYDPTWGRVKPITHPVPGNHEYLTSGGTGCNSSNAGAAGYFQYFAGQAGTSGNGWYSFNIDGWHIIALNSQCSVVGCGSTSAQYKWLKQDLAANPTGCKLAFWHIPLFSNASKSAATKSFWNLLYAAGADVILNGHYHAYERFAPQTPSGTVNSTNGIREFIVGTGGVNHAGAGKMAPNVQAFNNTSFGVLQLTLDSTSYSWQFLPAAGSPNFSDSGGPISCHT